MQTIFPNIELEDASENSTFFRDQAILTFRNDVLADYNQTLLGKLPEELHTYDSIDAVEDNAEKQQHLPQEFLRSLMPLGLPFFSLNLKVGEPIVLLRNLHPASEKCNGTRLIVTWLGRRCIESWMLRASLTVSFDLSLGLS